MSTYTNQSKNTTTFTNQAVNSLAGGTGTTLGSPMGLLLSLTYAATVAGAGWTNATKNSAFFTNQTKN
jgi:hypothetical protein